MYSQLQLWIRSVLFNLLEQLIDVLSAFLVTVGDKKRSRRDGVRVL